MPKSISDITAIVIDHGNYIAMAERLSRDYKKVYYCCSWQDGFPTWNKYSVGMNAPKVERVDHWAQVIDECDLVIFPDLYYGPLQEWLVERGYTVFGTRNGETMEIYRDEFKDLLNEFDLPVNPYKIVYGFEALKKYLDKTEDKWVKTSIIRGNGETFHWNNSRLSESRLDELQHSLGAFKEEATFVVETPIPEAVEIGYDGMSIDGNFPAKTLVGIEIKDAGYVGGIIPYNDLPPVLLNVNKKFSKFFANTNYRCFFSNEIRWTGKIGYFIDATCRMPQPPGDLQMEIYKNYAEIIWQVANGEVPEIIPAAKFGAQIIMKSSWAANDPQAIYFPKKYADRVKVKNMMYKDGLPYYIPFGNGMEEIGSCIGLGSTLEEAIEDAKKIAETVEGDSLTLNGEALDKAAGEIAKLEEYSIKLF